jgi:hypothetical protein
MIALLLLFAVIYLCLGFWPALVVVGGLAVIWRMVYLHDFYWEPPGAAKPVVPIFEERDLW